MGTLPTSPQQNSQLGAPFVYSLDQYRLAGEGQQRPQEDRNSIVASSASSSAGAGGGASGLDSSTGAGEEEESGACAAVLGDLAERGYYVLNGLQHGVDFVAYEGDPVRHHGTHFVSVLDPKRTIKARELVLWHRLAASAHKTAVLASVDVGRRAAPRYYLISREER
mmetsp:Transcript_13704/g.27644  ORF Transcript_13704/g.27644 Transcript_13704/m.27644 type:complete len:167 (-) Transcript_13704:60-560(-)